MMPRQFLTSVWVQNPDTFKAWREQGINTLVTPSPGFGGHGFTAADYRAAADAAGLFQIHGADPGTTGAEDHGNPLFLARNVPDEFDGQGRRTPAQLREIIAKYRGDGWAGPILGNITSNNAALQVEKAPNTGVPYAEYFGLPIDWWGGDIYPDNQGQPFLLNPWNIGPSQAYTTTIVGAAAHNLYHGPWRGQPHGAMGKLAHQCFALGRCDETRGAPGAGRYQRPERLRALLWSAVIHGVGHWLFFPQFVGLQTYVQNDAHPALLREMFNAVANVNRMQATGGNLLIDTRLGGRRPYTIHHCPPGRTNPNVSEQAIPADGNRDPRLAYLPSPFEGAAFVAGGRAYYLALNLTGAPQRLTHAPWGITGVEVPPYEVHFCAATKPAANLFGRVETRMTRAFKSYAPPPKTSGSSTRALRAL